MATASTQPSYSDILEGYVSGLANISLASKAQTATASTPAPNPASKPLAAVAAKPWFIPAILAGVLVLGVIIIRRRR